MGNNYEFGIAELRGEKDKEISPDPPCESAFLITFLAPAKSNAPRRAVKKKYCKSFILSLTR